MNKEKYRDIGEYKNYQVSNLGNVKHFYKNGKVKILKPQIINGYCYVGLSKNGKVKFKRVHQLVAKTFIDNPNKYSEVNHINGNKQDNKVNNLEWCSRQYNQLEMYRIGLRKPNKSKPFYQLDLENNIINKFNTLREAQKITGINNGYICQRLKDGKIGKGFLWRYVSE